MRSLSVLYTTTSITMLLLQEDMMLRYFVQDSSVIIGVLEELFIYDGMVTTCVHTIEQCALTVCVCGYICPCNSLSVSLSLCLSVCVFVYMHACIFVCETHVCLSVRICVCVSVCLVILMSVVCTHICLYICLTHTLRIHYVRLLYYIYTIILF